MRSMTYEQYDLEGKFRVADLFQEYSVPFNFTTYKYDKLDVYFGKSSVAEIKYRTRPYEDYLIQEDKVAALQRCPVSSKYYIVVLDSDIYFWKLSTILGYLPTKKFLPDATGSRWKDVRFLPAKAADFHFAKTDDDSWKLVRFD